MKFYILSLALSIVFIGCETYPKNFTYKYSNTKHSDSVNRINTEGYYIAQRECDSSFFSIFMFYPDGLFTIATTSETLLPELIDCFVNGGDSKICQYPVWGTYIIESDTIKTQAVRGEGSLCIIFRDYKILPDRSIVNISEYVEAQHTRLGYMRNYPSFKENACKKTATFYPTEKKRSSSECLLLNNKWFHKP